LEGDSKVEVKKKNMDEIEGIDWYKMKDAPHWTHKMVWSECLTCEYSSELERMRCNFAGKLVEPFLSFGSLSKGN
jgi:hypothetical protein